MSWLRKLAERRGWAALVLLLASAFGIQLEMGDGTTAGKAVAIASPAFIGACLALWSRLQKIERAELYRRLLAGVVPSVYGALAILVPDLADSQRAAVAQGLAGLLALLLGGWSFAQENTVRPAPNP